ncbi:hypothetical protein D3C85_1167300 [compost metagenome]
MRRVERLPRKYDQGPQQAHQQHGRQQTRDSGGGVGGAQRPPEPDGAAEDRHLHEPVDGVVRQGRRIEIGRVPGPEDHGLNRGRHRQTRRLQARKAQSQQGRRSEQEQEVVKGARREQG